MSKVITDQNFKEITSQGVVLIDFWAQWCGPCRSIGPVIDEIAKEYDGKAIIGKVNVDENIQLSDQLRINTIPAFIIFKDGKEVERFVGAKPKSVITAIIDKHL